MSKTDQIATDLALRNQGIISLHGELNNDSGMKAANLLLYMNSIEQPQFKAIQMILNSPGGTLWPAFMLIDLIECSKLPVYITGLGICASAGILLLCAGTKGHRVVTVNTALLSHQYSWQTDGKYHELLADREEQERMHKRMIQHYLKHTNLSEQEIRRTLLPKSDVWLTPQEAKKYGLIDKIVKAF